MRRLTLGLAVCSAVLATLMALVPALAAPPSRATPATAVEVKFQEGTHVRLRGAQLTGLSVQDADKLNSIRQTYGVLSITRLFSLSEEKLDGLKGRGEGLSRRRLPDLNLWFRFHLKQDADAEGLVQALKSLDSVEKVERALVPAPPPAITPDFTANQGYLNAATGGIDARYAWPVPGGNGAGVTIFDVEYSWNQAHEDLSKVNGLALLLNGGDSAVDPFSSNDHGTAVLGEMIADFNGIGVTGISWGAGIGLAPANTTNLGYNPANAISLATGAGSAGDVILIEQQTGVCGLPDPLNTCANCGPLEWSGGVFAAIQTAVANGIAVVEAAGNGNVNLDQAACGTYFQRATQDSGAIIVGAGQPPASGNDRQKEGFSTYGSRVDLQGWGSGVMTTGYGSAYTNPDDPTNPNFWYRSTFNGTSSASPIVAGAVADLQGVAMSQAGGPLTPNYVRTLLAQTGSPQLPNNTQNIGPRPNLGAAIPQLLLTDLSVTKLATPDPAVPGSLLTYQVTVQNNGPDFAPNVTVTDVLPANVTYLGNSDSCAQGPVGTLVCALGDLAAGSSRAFSINVQVSPSATGSIINSVSVDSDASDGNSANNSFQLSTALSPLADLRLTKVCKPDGPIQAGGTATCTIFVDNLGPSDAQNVVVTDTNLGSGAFTITSASFSPPLGGMCLVLGGVVTCNLGTVSAGGRVTIVVNVTAADAVDVNDTATVTSATPDPDPSNNVAQGAIHFTGAADLALTKTSALSSVIAGTNITYTLTVTNTGPSQAVNVVIQDQLPSQVTLVSVTPSKGTCLTGPPIVCNVDTLASGETVTIEIAATVKPETLGSIENDASVSSGTFDPDNSDNVVSVITPVDTSADLAVTKVDSPDPVLAGNQLKYEIRITNNGPSTARGVTLVDPLPSQVSYVGATIVNGTGTCTDPSGTLTCALNDLNPDAWVEVVVTVQVPSSVPKGTVITNTATASSSTPDPSGSNNNATATTTVDTQADLVITKEGEFDVTNPSVTIVYTVKVTNMGPSDAQNVVMTDTLPLNAKKVVFVFDTGNGACTYTAATQQDVCTVGTLAAGSSVSVKIYVQPRGNLGTITNVATVTSTTADLNLVNNTARKDLLVTGGKQRR